MDIGKQIAKYRKEKHITQEQFGEAVGATNRTVSKWEQGVSFPGIELAPRIASALGISLDRLFGIETKENADDLSQSVRKSVSYVLEDSLHDALCDALEDVLPRYMNDCGSADEYSLLILGRERMEVCRFMGRGSVMGPFRYVDNKYGIVIPSAKGNVIVGYYGTKEEASAALESIFKAYSERMEKIELK